MSGKSVNFVVSKFKMMTTIPLKKELHNAIEISDDRLLNMMYAIVKEYSKDYIPAFVITSITA